MRSPGIRSAALGLALLALAGAHAGRAEAGILLGTPTVRSGGDPWYRYSIPVFLDAGFALGPASGTTFTDPIRPLVDDYLTIYNVRGVTAVLGMFADPLLETGRLEPFGGAVRVGGTGYTPPGESRPPLDPYRNAEGEPDVYDVSIHVLRGYDAITNDTAGTILLGYFGVESQFPREGDETMAFAYSWQAGGDGGKESGGGTVGVVPEPAALLLLGLGASALALPRLRARRAARPKG